MKPRILQRQSEHQDCHSLVRSGNVKRWCAIEMSSFDHCIEKDKRQNSETGTELFSPGLRSFLQRSLAIRRPFSVQCCLIWAQGLP
jgi:hypothetical protein